MSEVCKSSAVREGIAGLTAGLVSTICVHPLDLVKTRLQIYRNRNTTWRIAQAVVGQDGNIRALYRGLVPNLVGNALAWGSYFVFYDQIKQWIKGQSDVLGSVQYFTASALAGSASVLCTNPIWVVKTRMLSSTTADTPDAYRSLSDGLVKIARHEGMQGLFRGLLPSILGVSHGAVQFMAYEKLKIWKRSTTTTSSAADLDNWEYVVLSATSKIAASLATYPYQVVRSRLQAHNADQLYGSSATDVIRQTLRHEGISGFYKGLIVNTVRVLPGTIITFVVYENTTRLLR